MTVMHRVAVLGLEWQGKYATLCGAPTTNALYTHVADAVTCTACLRKMEALAADAGSGAYINGKWVPDVVALPRKKPTRTQTMAEVPRKKPTRTQPMAEVARKMGLGFSDTSTDDFPKLVFRPIKMAATITYVVDVGSQDDVDTVKADVTEALGLLRSQGEANVVWTITEGGE